MTKIISECDEHLSDLIVQYTDRLPALAGIAEVFQQQIKSEYLAGLWREGLLGQLLWRRTSTQGHGRQPNMDPLQYREPSWSWASVDGGIVYPPSS